MKTLLLARHAKSNWDQPADNDFERTLNTRGEADVALMARHLLKCAYIPEQIISSDAVRALATANEYHAVLKPQKGLVENHELYLASVADILHVIKNVPSNIDVVMLVGHNPGMSDALNYFLPTKIQDMSTCSVGIVRFDVLAWHEVSEQAGELLTYESPKKLP